MNPSLIGIGIYLSGAMVCVLSWFAGITEGALSRRLLYGMAVFALTTLICVGLNYQAHLEPTPFQQVQLKQPTGDKP